MADVTIDFELDVFGDHDQITHVVFHCFVCFVHCFVSVPPRGDKPIIHNSIKYSQIVDKLLKHGKVFVMEHENPYVMEAVQWFKTKASLRPFHAIAEDAGMNVQNLRYQAMNILAGKTTNKRGKSRKTK